jgi:hypothetical protein
MDSARDTARVAPGRWVAPFGDPGITDRSHLPRACRSVPRPSSPLSAKASTRCPSFALHYATPNGKHRETRCCKRNTAGRTVPRACPGTHATKRGNSLSRRHKCRRMKTHLGTHAHASRPADGSRLGHTTRLFTSVHQQSPGGHKGRPRERSASCRVSRSGAPATLPPFGAVKPEFHRWWR